MFVLLLLSFVQQICIHKNLSHLLFNNFLSTTGLWYSSDFHVRITIISCIHITNVNSSFTEVFIGIEIKK